MTQPRYFIVGARPVQIVPTADGGLDCLVLDWQSGQMRRDMTYLTRCIGPAPDVEVDEVDAATFRRQLIEHQSGASPDPTVPPTRRQLHLMTWSDVLQRFLRAQGMDDWADRVPGQDPAWGWDRHEDRLTRPETPIPMGYLGTSYVESFATVRWPAAVLHLTVQDSKTGAADHSEDLTIPDGWLQAFLAVPWPVTGAQPWF